MSGEEFDTLLTIDCIAKFKRRTTIDISRKAAPVRRLRLACEHAKKRLSEKNYTVIRAKNLAEEENFEKSYTQEQWKEIMYVKFKQFKYILDQFFDG